METEKCLWGCLGEVEDFFILAVFKVIHEILRLDTENAASWHLKSIKVYLSFLFIFIYLL